MKQITDWLTTLRKATRSILIFCFTVVLLLGFSSLASNSQTLLREVIISPPQASPVDQENLAKTIANIEQRWEGQYESYCDQDFPSQSLSASEIAATLAQLSRQTDTKPAVLWVIPQAKQLKVVLITPGNPPISKEIRPANRQLLLTLVQQFQEQLTDTSAIAVNSPSYLPAAQQLYQWLVAPIEPDLQSQQIDTILFCFGPGLRTLPFAALHDGKHFLVEKYSLTRIPGFNLTDTHYCSLRNAEVLAMGASEFANQPPLPGVAVELATITPKLWPGLAFLNQDFTVANLQAQRQQREFELIHLATHAEFNPGISSNSYIQFFDRQLGLNQIRELGWNDPPVELLVLSACRTALGDETAELGFAGLALQSGVKSALASLWDVSDVGTMALMSEFYQQLKVVTTKAEALRQAQIAMLTGQIRLERGELRGSRGSVELPPMLANLEAENWSHPFYWAAFSLIGSPW